MKALLRTAIVALIVFAGYAALATDLKAPHHLGAAMPKPSPTCIPGGCAIGK